jgi:hypothetical protein
MEKVSLNNVQLDYLAKGHPSLGPHFYGTRPCDRLPQKPDKKGPVGYIVNTDPQGQPGRHWIALWTHDNVCEVLDSYAIPLETYRTTQPLQAWLDRHWKYVVSNGQSLQSLYSQSCGDYALMFLIDRAEGNTMNTFLNRFEKHDYVQNDHKVGQMLKRLIVNELEWGAVCKTKHQQDASCSCYGVRHLLQ